MTNKMPVVGKRYQHKSYPEFEIIIVSIWTKEHDDNLSEKNSSRHDFSIAPSSRPDGCSLEKCIMYSILSLPIKEEPFINSEGQTRVFCQEEWCSLEDLNKYFEDPDLQNGEANEIEKALEAEKKVTQKHYDLEAVTRLEIIDSNGRSYVNLHANPMEFSYQDHGKTLKIFCGNKEDMSKPEPKIDMKKERVDPVSIWKDVSELPKILEEDTVDSLIRDKNGNVARTIFYNENGEIDHSPSGLEFEKEYCTLTDFINSFEQMQKDIERIFRSLKTTKNSESPVNFTT